MNFQYTNTRLMMMMNCFCGMADRQKAFSLISSWDHCQRSSPSRISDTPRAGFEPAQNLSSSFVEWSCAVVITTTPGLRLAGGSKKKVLQKFDETNFLVLNLVRQASTVFFSGKTRKREWRCSVLRNAQQTHRSGKQVMSPETGLCFEQNKRSPCLIFLKWKALIWTTWI